MDRPVALASHFVVEPAHQVPVPVAVWGVDDLMQTIPASIGQRRVMPCPHPDSPAPSAWDLEVLGVLTLRLSLTARRSPDVSVGRLPLHSGLALMKALARIKVIPLADYPGAAMSVARLLGVPKPAFRSERSWVGGTSPRHACRIPPAGEDITRLLDDLATFLRANAGGDVRALADAFAYQFLATHPLSDGNGRVLRALLVGLARLRQSTYPIFLAWCDLFLPGTLMGHWEKARVHAHGLKGEASLERRWSEHAAALGRAHAGLHAEGMDRRLLIVLSMLGWASVEAFCALFPECGQGLAHKVLRAAEPLLRTEREGIRTCPLLDVDLDRTLRSWQRETELPGT